MSRIQSPVDYEYGGKYRFVLRQDLVVNIKKGLQGFHILRDGKTAWAMLDCDTLTIFAGYAFDGCSPAWRIFGRWYGTPTPPCAVAAAAVHDCLRGYMRLACIGITRQDTDAIFYNMLKEAGFRASEVYHGAVAGPLGGIYLRLTGNRPSEANCKCHGNYTLDP